MTDVAPSPLPGEETDKAPSPEIPPIRMKRINYENLFTEKERTNQKRLASIFSVDQTNKVFTADGLRIMEEFIFHPESAFQIRRRRKVSDEKVQRALELSYSEKPRSVEAFTRPGAFFSKRSERSSPQKQRWVEEQEAATNFLPKFFYRPLRDTIHMPPRKAVVPVGTVAQAEKDNSVESPANCQRLDHARKEIDFKRRKISLVDEALENLRSTNYKQKQIQEKLRKTSISAMSSVERDPEDLKFSINVHVSPKTASNNNQQLFSAMGQKRNKKTAFLIKRRTAGSKTQQNSERRNRRKIGLSPHDHPV